jgi:hypothetical protein
VEATILLSGLSFENCGDDATSYYQLIISS